MNRRWIFGYDAPSLSSDRHNATQSSPVHAEEPLFTGVRGIGILGCWISTLRSSSKFAFKEFYEVGALPCNTASSQTSSPGSAVAPVPRTERGPRLLNIGNSL